MKIGCCQGYFHTSAWKGNSTKFAHENIATWHTKIRHMGDAPHPARLLPYLWDVTQGGGPKPFALRPDSKRKGGHVAAAEERWRELRAQGAQIDAAARAEPPRRRLEAVPEATSATKKPLAKKPLGLVWVVTSSYSITTEGLKQVLEGKAEVQIGGQSLAGSPSCVVLYAGGMEEGCLEGMGRIRELYPGVPLLVFGSQLDLGLASSALKQGADGFVHAQMHPAQVLSAVEVVQKGELAAPRQLLRYLLSQKENPKIGGLSARKREILDLLVEGLSNAEIAGRLYLSESTIKQHLRAAYKVLGVHNRTQAARTMRHHAGGV
jgi:DNA-binding NarL/FixJ family response regulator